MGKGHHSGLKLSQLRALVAVADAHNFGEAAWQLGLTQPTVSHAISTLEEELGVILVIRGRQGAHLAPAGEAVVHHARDILHQLDRIQTTANMHKGLQGGHVRVATFRSAAAHLLPTIMVHFQTNHPAIKVTMTEFYDYIDVEQQVRSSKADIGLTFLPTQDEFETWEIMRDPYWVLLPPGSEQTAPRLNWDQVRALPLVMYPRDNSCFIHVRNYFQQAGYVLEPRYQFRETHTILNMVAQGLGAAIIPSLSSIPLPPGVTVVQLPIPLERTVGAILLADTLQTPAVFAFWSMLRQHPLVVEDVSRRLQNCPLPPGYPEE